MVFHTFGNKENKVMMLIHGMLTPWQIWEEAAAYFSKDYYVIVPELDAHTEDESTLFESVEKEAEQIAKYLTDNFGGNIHALCGLSMGGRIAATVAAMPGIHADNLVMDGAPLKKMPGFMVGVMKKNYIRIIDHSKKREPKLIESFKKDFLPEKYLDPFFKIADNMQEQSIENILVSVFQPFAFPKYDEKTRVLFMHGTKGNESLSKKSAQLMKEANPQTEIRCFDGYMHAQLACFENEKWVKEVETWLSR